ncbi:hypothetical protein BDN72DRAFT_839391 [Pluteus cervinus]|uniref:Uncharacterized protein n=1 Tax=Pluteus cervinus TaxID=181527 RepID=A0ACD3AWT6_9AGAR|nr:hypothetical protein BDN72DRAFT_839391 [Pluteus cervinus]
MSKPKRFYPSGTIVAINESLNHPLIRYLKDNNPHPLSAKSTLCLESILTRLENVNTEDQKLRPCLVLNEEDEINRDGSAFKSQQRLYLLGTMAGKNRLMMDSFTQEFAIPVYPTPGSGDYQLKLTPTTPKHTSYLIGCPLGIGVSNPIYGLWKTWEYDPAMEQETTTTYQVEPEELIRLKVELRRRHARFKKRTGEHKKHIIKAYLKVTEARTRRPQTLAPPSIECGVSCMKHV